MSSPAAGFAFNNYITKATTFFERPIPHAEGGRVQRGLDVQQFVTAIDLLKKLMVNPYS